MQRKTMGFSHFLEYFPTVEFPIHLGEETHRVFSQRNEPLPPIAIEQYIVPLEDDIDETVEADLIEYIPCFRFPKTHSFQAIVYWRAALMNYQYVLVTFEPDGTFIAKKVLAGLLSDGDALVQSAATIEDDWTIYVVTGYAENSEELYDAQKSKAIDLEVLPDGTIITPV